MGGGYVATFVGVKEVKPICALVSYVIKVILEGNGKIGSVYGTIYYTAIGEEAIEEDGVCGRSLLGIKNNKRAKNEPWSTLKVTGQKYKTEFLAKHSRRRSVRKARIRVNALEERLIIESLLSSILYSLQHSVLSIFRFPVSDSSS